MTENLVIHCHHVCQEPSPLDTSQGEGWEDALRSPLPDFARRWDTGDGISALLPCTKEAPGTLLIRNGSTSPQGSLPVAFRAVGCRPAHHATLIPGGSAVRFWGRHSEKVVAEQILSPLM